MLSKSLEVIVVGDWETNKNDSITCACPCTFGAFLGLMPSLDLENKSKIGVQL
jgi:hypothetical protein